MVPFLQQRRLEIKFALCVLSISRAQLISFPKKIWVAKRISLELCSYAQPKLSSSPSVPVVDVDITSVALRYKSSSFTRSYSFVFSTKSTPFFSFVMYLLFWFYLFVILRGSYTSRRLGAFCEGSPCRSLLQIKLWQRQLDKD